MGRATITGGGTDGLYTISVDHGTAERDAEVTRLEARQVILEASIVTLESIVLAYSAEEAAALNDLDTAIGVYNASDQSDADKSALYKSQLPLYEIIDNKRQQNTLLTGAEFDLAAVNKRLAFLSSLDLTETKSAWCADYTEDASGEVATIDVGNEPGTTLIAPTGRSPQPSDGIAMHSAVQSAAQNYYNLATLPGWGKFMPTYRVGVITSIDDGADTCSVDLDAATSSQQTLNINQAESLSNVPVVYMSCHAAVFSVDDRVIVKFNGQDWADPVVIGFESNPEICLAKRIFFYMESYLDGETYTPGGDPYDYYITGGENITATNDYNGITDLTRLYYDYPASNGVEEYDAGFGLTGIRLVEPYYSKGAIPTPGQHIPIRVRFDSAWYQDTGASQQYSAQVSGGYTVQGYASNTLTLSVTSSKVGVSFLNSTFDTTESTLSGSGTIETYNPFTMETTEYNTASGYIDNFSYYMHTSVPGGILGELEYPSGRIDQDRRECNDFILDHYSSPPSTIYVDYDGEWIEYVFESIGPRPDYFSSFENDISISTLAGDSDHPDTRDMDNAGQLMGVIYRQVDYAATD